MNTLSIILIVLLIAVGVIAVLMATGVIKIPVGSTATAKILKMVTPFVDKKLPKWSSEIDNMAKAVNAKCSNIEDKVKCIEEIVNTCDGGSDKTTATSKYVCKALYA
jgi:hypothetical protein